LACVRECVRVDPRRSFHIAALALGELSLIVFTGARCA
jgi:hypothetical protein